MKVQSHLFICTCCKHVLANVTPNNVKALKVSVTSKGVFKHLSSYKCFCHLLLQIRQKKGSAGGSDPAVAQVSCICQGYCDKLELGGRLGNLTCSPSLDSELCNPLTVLLPLRQPPFPPIAIPARDLHLV